MRKFLSGVALEALGVNQTARAKIIMVLMGFCWLILTNPLKLKVINIDFVLIVRSLVYKA